MDPIEIEDWLRGNAAQHWQRLVLRTSDQEEIRAHNTALPTDYPWIEPDAALLHAVQETSYAE
jgi:hypothetical protein